MNHPFWRSCLLAFAYMFFFTACSGKSPLQEPSSSPGSSSAAVASSAGTVSILTDPYGGLYKTGCSTQAGYYDQFALTPSSVNILYTDYSSRQRVFLCNKPDCLHNNEACTSWFSITGDIKLFTNKANTQLFLISSGYADQGEDESKYRGKIYKMDPNGENRSVLYSLAGNESFADAVAADDQFLYATILYMDKTQIELKKEIRRIDMNTGSASLVCPLDSLQERVFGAFGHNLVIEKISGTERSYYCLNCADGAKSESTYHYDFSQSVRTEMVYANNVYSIRAKADTLTDVYQIDLQTGDEALLVSDLEVYDMDASHIAGFYNEHIEVAVTDNRDTNAIKFLLYNIDLNTHALRQSNLKFSFYKEDRNVTILGESNEFFLVEMGLAEGKATLIDNAGVPYQVDTIIPQYALISKSDYWSSVPNYIPIQDNTL